MQPEAHSVKIQKLTLLKGYIYHTLFARFMFQLRMCVLSILPTDVLT